MDKKPFETGFQLDGRTDLTQADTPQKDITQKDTTQADELMESYGSQVQELKFLSQKLVLPQAVSTAVENEARTMANTSATGAVGGATNAASKKARLPRAPVQRPLRYVSVAAATVFALLGVTVVGGALTNQTQHAGGSGAGIAASSVSQNVNSFMLTAYARGSELTSNTHLAIPGFGTDLSYSEGENNTIKIDATFDFSAEGQNIKTLTYELEGSDGREGYPARAGEVRYWFDNIEIPQSGQGTPQWQSSAMFTVDYNAQARAANGIQRNLSMILAQTPQLKAALDELKALSYQEVPNATYYEAVAKVQEEVRKLYAQELQKITIKMTATFEDGTQATSRYRISPTQDAAEVYTAYQQKFTELMLAQEQNPSDTSYSAQIEKLMTQEAPQIFVIELVE